MQKLDVIYQIFESYLDVVPKSLTHLFVKTNLADGQRSDEVLGGITALETITLNNPQDDVSHGLAMCVAGAIVKLVGKAALRNAP